MTYEVLDVCRYVINYSDKKGYEISNLKLQKLLYFIQAYFLIVKGEPCFSDAIEAWNFGPVIPKAYHEYKQFGCGNIPPIKSFIQIDKNDVWNSKRVSYDDSAIEKDDKMRVNAVVDLFADYCATNLVELTQKQAPWINSYVSSQHNEIKISAISEYFRKKEKKI